MQKLILIPSDKKQKPIDILVNRVATVAGHLKLVLPDGEVRFLPRSQIKEYKLLSVDEVSEMEEKDEKS